MGLGTHALLEAASRVDMAATIHTLEVLSMPSRFAGFFLGVLFARLRRPVIKPLYVALVGSFWGF